MSTSLKVFVESLTDEACEDAEINRLNVVEFAKKRRAYLLKATAEAEEEESTTHAAQR